MVIIFIAINLFLSTFSVIPLWNLKNCSVDLLQNEKNYSYIITHREMYKMEAKLVKEIKKNDEGKIINENTLYINGISKGKVNYENLDSFYYLEGYKNLSCPMGKHHPIDLDNNMSEIENNDFYSSNANWELKCYNHLAGYFFVFYLGNGENQVYALKRESSLYNE